MTAVVPLLLALSLQSTPSPAPTTVDVRIPSGDIQLAGLITTPRGGGRRVGVVLVGGSGPFTRQMMKPFADHFNALDVVTLTFDKRGVGESQGDWTAASLDDLADDVAAAMGVLASRAEVDPKRVGVWAVSQGGWAVPLLATRTPRAAFAVVLTGGGATPREVELAGYRHTLDGAGATGQARVSAEALLERYFAWLATGSGRDVLDQAVADVREEGWYKAMGLARVMPSEAARPKWAWVATHDPVPAIAKIAFPVLVVLGGQDPLAPAEASARAWREGFRRGSNRDFRIEIVPEMAHAGRVGEHSHDAPFSPQYLDILRKWIETR